MRLILNNSLSPEQLSSLPNVAEYVSHATLQENVILNFENQYGYVVTQPLQFSEPSIHETRKEKKATK